MRRLQYFLAAGCCLIFLTGCSLLSGSKTAAEAARGGNLKLTIANGYDLNPNDRGDASPLKIRVYELSSSDLFEQADFLDLFDQDSATLQDSLITVHRIPVQYPGQTTEINLTLNASTRFLGVLAEFFRYQQADARGVGLIRADRNNVGHLTIDGNRLLLTLTPELTIIDQAKTLWPWAKDPQKAAKDKLPVLPKAESGSSGQ